MAPPSEPSDTEDNDIEPNGTDNASAKNKEEEADFLGYAIINLALPFLGFEKNGPVVVSSAFQRPIFQSTINELCPKLEPLNADFAISVAFPKDRVRAETLTHSKVGIKDLKLTDSVQPFKVELLDGHHRQQALLKNLFPGAGDLKTFVKFSDEIKEGNALKPKEQNKWTKWLGMLREGGRWVAALYDKGQLCDLFSGISDTKEFRFQVRSPYL